MSSTTSSANDGSLTVAALLNQLSEVQKLLAEGRSVDETDDWGDSALHAAALKGRLTVAKLLIDKGADVNKTNNAGSTPLHKAVVSGNAHLIELLMQHGADGDLRNHAGLLPEDYTKKKSLKLMVLGKSAVEIKVPVPRAMRGLVIGQGGKTLKRIRTASGADVAFPLDEEVEEVVIRGRAEATEKARELVEEIVNKRKEVEAVKEAKEKEFYSGDYTRITVKVPKHQHKLIIGAGGKTIREIIKDTGAKIKIPPGDDDDEEVVIEGSPEAVDQAAERVTKATMFQERDNAGGGGGRGRGRPRREEGEESGGYGGGDRGGRGRPRREEGEESGGYGGGDREERRFGEGGGGRGRGGGGRGRDREGGERQGSNITLASFLVPSRSTGRRRGDN